MGGRCTMLRIVTRKTVKEKLAEQETVQRWIVTKSARTPVGGMYYHNRVYTHRMEIRELENKYERALKWGFQLVWE